MAELTYTRVGDYYIPNLILDEEPGQDVFYGKYGNLRCDYLREHRPKLWMVLVNSGKLADHLKEVEDTANNWLDRMMPDMTKAAGATEELKARDPMHWVGLMNCCKAQVEEMIFAEIIYT